MTAVLDRLSSPRILQGSQADIWVELELDGETTPDVASGATIGITDEDGNEIIAAGTAVEEPTGTGRIVYTLTPAVTNTVNKLVATWSFTLDSVAMSVTSHHEIVGDMLFTLGQARRFGSGELGRSIPGAGLISDRTILEERDRITDDFGEALGYELGRRACRDVLSGSGLVDLYLSRNKVASIRSAGYRTAGGVTYTAYTSTELADMFVSEYGLLARETLGTWPTGNRNLKVVYECGVQPIPGPLRTAGLILLHDRLLPGGPSRRTLSQTDETGNYTFATPGLRGSEFGLPDVDVAIARYRDKLPGIA